MVVFGKICRQSGGMRSLRMPSSAGRTIAGARRHADSVLGRSTVRRTPPRQLEPGRRGRFFGKICRAGRCRQNVGMRSLRMPSGAGRTIAGARRHADSVFGRSTARRTPPRQLEPGRRGRYLGKICRAGRCRQSVGMRSLRVSPECPSARDEPSSGHGGIRIRSSSRFRCGRWSRSPR